MTENPLLNIWRDMARIQRAIASGILFATEQKRLAEIATTLSTADSVNLTEDQKQALEEGSKIAQEVFNPNEIPMRYAERVYPPRKKIRT